MIQNSGNVYEKVFGLIENKGITLLDCGAGDGSFCKDAIKKGYKPSACGYEDLHIKNIPFKKVDLNKEVIPYGDATFDIVTAIELIEHLQNPFHLIRELNRVCKKDGYVIISTPNTANWYYRLYYLLFGKLIGFDKNNGYSLDHIMPIHAEIFDPYLQIYFDLITITTNRSFIPLLRINIPIDHNLFGDSRIIMLRKK